MADTVFFLRLFSTPGLFDSEDAARSSSSQPLLPPSKPLALLTFLLVEERAVPREELVELLWPEVDQAHGKGSLRQALWSLRKVLGDEAFQADETVALHPGLVDSDLARFQASLEQGKLEAARVFWTGPLLDGMEFPGTRTWGRWIGELRSQEERRFGSALADAAGAARAAEKLREARRWLEMAAEVQPYSPSIHRSLVQTLLEVRAYQAAEDALASARKVLADARTPVDGEFAELEERLRVLRFDLEADDETHPLRTEFVGRTVEFSGLATAWRRARLATSEVALVLGTPGIGKTRLVQELVALARSDGSPAVTVKAVEAERNLQWGTASEIVRSLYSLPGAAGISNRSASVLARLVPSLGAFDPEQKGLVSGRVEPAAVTDALLDLVSAVAHEGPLLLFVDDLQWIDKESRASLSYLARNLESEAVLLVIACRTGERDPEVGKAVDSLLRSEGARSFLLLPLGSQDVSELLALLLEDVEPDEVDALGQRIHGITQGNPLFIVEILKLLHAQELLEPGSRGKWILERSCIEGRLPVPETVESAILRRLEDLGDPAELLAIQLARHARPMSPEDLQRQSALDPFQVSEGIRELFDRDLIRRDAQGRIGFVHDAVMEVARGHLDSPAWTRRARESQDQSRRRRRWIPWALGAAAVSALILAGFGGVGPLGFLGGDGSGTRPGARATSGSATDTDEAYPYGRGRIFVGRLTGSGGTWIRPPAMRDGEWEVEDTVFPVAHPGMDGVFRLPSDSLIIFVRESEGSQPPAAAILQSDGSVSTFWQVPGDVGVRDISPDGRTVLLTQERIDAPRYAHNLLAVDRDTRRSRLLFEAPERNQDARWSPDGLKIAAILRYSHDSIRILDTRGRTRATYGIPGEPTLGRLSWCADSRMLAFSARERGRHSVGILDTSTGIHEILDSGRGGFRDLVCLGEAVALAYPRAQGGRLSLWVLDLDTRDLVPVSPSMEGYRPGRIHWVPDHAAPVIQELTIQPSAPSILWGDQTTLNAVGTFSDGTEMLLEVAWEALDPNRASVDSRGMVTGNQAGPAPIVAHYGPWMSDTVTVQVQEWERPGVALSADFQGEDLSQWEPFGDPLPRPVEVQADTVLSLEGDGRFFEGVASRESFTLEEGGRLEVVFRLDLTRSDRQRITFCVQPDTVEGPRANSAHLGGIFDLAYCLRYPAMEQVKFDSLDLLVFYPAQGSEDFVRLPEGFDSSDWTQFALEVQPDGQVALYVNQELLQTLPTPLMTNPGVRWRILLTGASVDTELYVRSVTVYEGDALAAPGRPPGPG